MTFFADTRFSNRRRALAAEMAGRRIDSMLVTHLTHVRYLSGFSGSNGALVLSKDLSARIATDGRYTTQIAEEVPDIDCLNARNVAVELLKEITGPCRVGFEAAHVTMVQFDALNGACGDDVTLVPVTGLIEEIRLTKDQLELERLTGVAELASTALQQVLDAGELAVGRTERQVAADLEYRMRMLGAERVSFDTIVASGPNSAKPHHGAGDRVIEPGDLVTVDFGAHDRGFNSDCTRTYIMGHTTEFTEEIYSLVHRAQAAGVEAATPGTPLREVDAACRDIIAEAGYGEYFVHSTGHGIGLDVHEPPMASATGSGELREGMTLTIEPGVYIPGRGGVRIEDTLIITAGAPKVITRLPKDLRVI
ncbi:Xaa-Pro peptidase family protein [Corynebacterium sp. P7003]|uniref:Xaa-Pro peptidase family protein n=1 Tax=Corynebacterium pygosceleis TaxID=2800406 RepID=A0ABT3WR61_9CORY|nr:Xaa-Pro peptidase family protein [Corynebacterium pygosceleis]MCX7443814.1 Xaa-Pro peptidase family protein [Corynebacterium pygosceleis]